MKTPECFQRRKDRPDGLEYRCKQCDSVRRKKRTQKIKQDLFAYAKHRQAMRERRLMADFGMTEEQFQSLLLQQGGVCAICRKPEKRTNKRGVRRLSVDHEHATGKVRALLCCDCNSGLGLFEEDPDLLRAAAEYVEKYKVQSHGFFFGRKVKKAGRPIGDSLKKLRTSRGISQDQLSAATGITQNHLSHLENNKRCPTIPTMQKIADALGVPLAEVSGP